MFWLFCRLGVSLTTFQARHAEVVGGTDRRLPGCKVVMHYINDIHYKKMPTIEVLILSPIVIMHVDAKYNVYFSVWCGSPFTLQFSQQSHHLSTNPRVCKYRSIIEQKGLGSDRGSLSHLKRTAPELVRKRTETASPSGSAPEFHGLYSHHQHKRSAPGDQTGLVCTKHGKQLKKRLGCSTLTLWNTTYF